MTSAADLDAQWGRKCSLLVASNDDAIDLSQMHIKFRVLQSDQESPNTAVIRVYNLSDETKRKVTGRNQVEYTRVILQAGYASAAFGAIFDGTIKQFREGRENATDSYLDILAAAGDIEYNFGVCNTTIAAGSSSHDRLTQICGQIGIGVSGDPAAMAGGILPRGKVLWGMARALIRNEAAAMGATWSIQDGRAVITPTKGYLPGEAVVLSALTGLVGIPEQTEDGIRVRSLLNPKLRIGGLVQIDNASINTMSQADLRAGGWPLPVRNLPVGQVPFDRYAGVQNLANVTSDGFYRLYVVEYEGDTRGQPWYANSIGLAVDKSTNTVLAQ